MERRRSFSREFKLEAVKLVVERGVSAAQAATDLDVHENVLRNGKQKAQDAEIARLRKEVAKQKMESFFSSLKTERTARKVSQTRG